MADIVCVQLTRRELELAAYYAKQAEIGGASNIRSGKDRTTFLSLDQFMGAGIGELIGNKFFFSKLYYVWARQLKNAHPLDSDFGCDTPGYKIDYKTSIAHEQSLLGYHLAVRPREWHPDHTYVLILVDTFGVTDVDELIRTGKVHIYLVGWATTAMIPADTEKEGIFRGAYVLRARELQPIASLKVERVKRAAIGGDA